MISEDFAEEYIEKFKDFTDKKLPKDELYYSIKDQIEAKEKEKEAGKKKR